MSIPGRVLLVCVVAVGSGSAYAQGPTGNGTPKVRIAEADFEAERLKRVITAVRITDKITLDGRLDEPAWKQAVPVTDFIQRIPRTGEGFISY